MIKSPDAFRTISEVAEDLGLPQHVLRFWETRFPQVKPMKRGGGRRYYRPEDMELLRGIQHLLYDEGYTIRGVRRILKENGNRYVIAAGKGGDLRDSSVDQLQPESRGHEDSVERISKAGGKQAVSVSEIMEDEKRAAMGVGLFRHVTGKKTETRENEVTPNLSMDERKALQETLYDLLECKRLLDHAR